MKQPAVLTKDEVALFNQAAKDPNLLLDYMFKPYGGERGWRLDENFTKDGAWQTKMHQAEQRDIVVIGGFGTGKTKGVGMSAVVWSLLTPNFRFLNIAPKAWQAKQMYDSIIMESSNCRINDFIWESPRRPFPRIIWRYQIGKFIVESSMEFMSADGTGANILSWEGDWINIDEAGLVSDDQLEEIIINAGSRLRGKVKSLDGQRTRLGRFSMTSNSWDNYVLWSYFDQAVADPRHFLSIVVSSRSNKNITDDQLARMTARIPKNERQRFIDGGRPTGKGRYFNHEDVYACEDETLEEIAEHNANLQLPDYIVDRLHGAGVVEYRVPPIEDHLYLLVGDPGISNAPKRNSPVLMVLDATDFPRVPSRLVAFWWGNGGGKIFPFMDMLFELIRLYTPIISGIDSTGTQKNVTQLINEYIWKERIGQEGYQSPVGITRGIAPLDFSGSNKYTYLQVTRLFIEAGLFRWPKFITGLRSQLTNYDPDEDTKIAQDIVACLSQAGFLLRRHFHVDLEALRNQFAEELTAAVLENHTDLRRTPQQGRQRRSLSRQARSEVHIAYQEED